MRRRGPQPDAECYSLAIDTVARKGHWSAADALLQAMHAAGLKPGPGGYGVVMAACHRAGQGERVLALLEVTKSNTHAGQGRDFAAHSELLLLPLVGC